MWISHVLGSIKPCRAALLLVAWLVVATAAAQDQGQYRSRILLDPLGEMGKGSDMSVAELEARIDSIEEPYARATGNRFLARHAAGEGDHATAIAYYRDALAARGLSDVANREMLRELAQLYMLNENYAEAARALQRALDMKLQPEPADYLLLAQAHYRRGDYVAVVTALDAIGARGLQLDNRQLGQSLALYYRVGAYQQAETVLQQLLVREPHHGAHWHQLAHVYLQQNKQQAALDQLTLALEKNVPFTADQLTLLIDLRAANGNPFGAAVLLEASMTQGVLPADTGNQRKLFELWLQARERSRARQALKRAAQSSGDTELYLYLAQLQMEDGEWRAMTETVLASCGTRLQDRYVSRANLLLGVGLLKLGEEVQARSAFINASLVGGAQQEAGQWLQYMGATPPTKAELRQVRGPCYGSSGVSGTLGKNALLAASYAGSAGQQGATAAMGSKETEDTIEVTTLPARRYFAITGQGSLASLLPQLRTTAVQLNMNLVKAGGTADGPLTVILASEDSPQIALPVRGSPQARGRYRMLNTLPFKCAWMDVADVEADPGQTLQRFREAVSSAGYVLTGEVRLEVFQGEVPRLQLQLGIE